MFNFGTPIGKLNMVGGECKTTIEQRKKIYNEIAKDYAEHYNAPYVHIFENGKFVDTICTKGVICEESMVN